MQTDVVKKLNDMRLERKLSVYRLAELTGLNQSTLANTFSRGLVPSLGNLYLICEAMGVTLSQFFTESESEFKLTESEACMLAGYRRLPQDVQKLFSELIDKYVRII